MDRRKGAQQRSRRELLRRLAAAVCLARFSRSGAAAEPAAPFEVERLLIEYPHESAGELRRYRADAVVSIFALPVFSRAGVGGGFASLREENRDGVSVFTARFGAGSFPRRAHNLNRLGFIEEVVVSRGRDAQQAAYFGFMTASPEERAADARRALEGRQELVPYLAAEGRYSRHSVRSVKSRFLLPGNLTWAERGSLWQRVRTQFFSGETETQDAGLDGSAWPGTFLHLMAAAIRESRDRFHGNYVYNSKQFHLSVEKQRDHKAGAAFASRGLLARPEPVTMLRGVITGGNSEKTTKFKVWCEEGGASALPLRIELEARSFLALAFEFDPNQQGGKESMDI